VSYTVCFWEHNWSFLSCIINQIGVNDFCWFTERSYYFGILSWFASIKHTAHHLRVSNANVVLTYQVGSSWSVSLVRRQNNVHRKCFRSNLCVTLNNSLRLCSRIRRTSNNCTSLATDCKWCERQKIVKLSWLSAASANLCVCLVTLHYSYLQWREYKNGTSRSTMAIVLYKIMSGYMCRNKYNFSFQRNIASDEADWTSSGSMSPEPRSSSE